MNLYAFSSNNLTNIWAGIGAQMWAVSKPSKQTMKQRVTTSQKMPIGAAGVLYCKETKSFSTPFIVYSLPDPNKEIRDVWPEPWVLPFSIKPLGTPRKLLSVGKAKSLLPSVVRSGKSNISHVLFIHGQMAFIPSPVTESDWEVLIEHLAD